METLQIIFFGLCVFFGTGQQPRTVIVLDLSRGEEVHGHKVQAHAAFIHVRPGYVVRQKTKWPCRDKPCNDFELDNRTLEIKGIANKPWQVDDSHARLVPHLQTECPELKAKDPDVLKPAAAANIVLSSGTLCAHHEKGAVSSVYKVMTNGETTITATRPGHPDRVLVLKPNAIIEIRNEPVEKEVVGNHFIAYYKQVAANDACCTNLPYRPVKDKDDGCPLPKDVKEVSTVACSNSNYP
jgi:hypothetical protein